MFNYNHLYYFYLTAKFGGVMTASSALKISQPSLSSQIKTLEHELKLQLFHKVGRRLALTPDGERAYGFCRKIFEAAEEFADHLKHSDSTRNHRCRIGVTFEIERPFIADVLSSLLRNKPVQEQPFLSMISKTHAELVEHLKSGELDAIVTNHSIYGPDIKIVAELSMPVIAVATPSLIKTLSIQKSDSLSKTLKGKSVGLVLPSDQLKIRIETDLCLQKQKIRNPIVFESDILAVVVRAASEGVGIAFLPRHYVSKELKCDTLVPVGDGTPLWHHTILIASRNIRNQDPTVMKIRDHFFNLGAKVSPD